jgi:DNA-binding HxlR family transcriptional regulator
MRSGAHTLLMLAAPLNVQVLRALTGGAKQQAELRRETGYPAQTTLRAQLKRLAEIGAIEKRRRNRFPGVLEYDSTPAGRDLLFVAEVLERWLEQAPDGPRPLEGSAAKAAVKALADGWSTTMLRALAARPFSLTELDGMIGSLSYPALERRLAALRLADLAAAQPAKGRGRPYGVTEWLRQGVGPIAAAVRWERRHMPHEAAPLARLDVEASFLLAVPLVCLPAEQSGTCQMAIEVPNGGRRRLAGVTIEVTQGAITSCITKLRTSTVAWALGSPSAWLDALIERDVDRLELGGNRHLAVALLGGLNAALFSPQAPQMATRG